jgi:LPS sulfotransferase NodH
MNINFVIFSQARSGSTWLVNALNNIDGVTSYGELFLNDYTIYEDGQTKMPRFMLWKQARQGFRPFSTYQYLDDVYSGNQSNGFKLMYPQLFKFPELAPALVFRKVRVIHLIRKNTLSAVLSNMVAFQRGRYHYTKNEKIPDEELIVVDPNLLISTIRLNNRATLGARSLLKIFRLRHIEIYYEDLSANKDNFKPIWDFLGEDIKKSPPSWKLRKIRKKSPVETIENYKEVQAALENAGYANYLE